MKTKFLLTKRQPRPNRGVQQNLRLSPEFRGGRGAKWRELIEICSKAYFFLKFFALFLDLRGDILSQKGDMGTLRMF